jgi:hypothetical protein
LTTVDRRGTSGESTTITRYEGSFDPVNLVAVAKRKLTAEVIALPPGAVYAFRRCVAHCDQDLTSKERQEEIEVIGPRTALWTGSSASTDKQAKPEGQAFTDISARIAPSGSATVLLTFLRAELEPFSLPNETSDQQLPPVVTFSLEIVWPLGRIPEATLFTGGQYGAPEELVKPKAGAAPFSACVPL